MFSNTKGDYMAFYKLFCIVHRRTDWGKLHEWAREQICPELFEKRKARETMELLFARPYLEIFAGHYCDSF
jgi:hypothetical protein